VTLPWDELHPDEPPEPVSPIIPPEPVPGPGHPHVPQEPPHEAIERALDDLWPAVKAKALDYAKDSWEGIREGQTVDVLHPTIVAEDMTGRELIVADAKSRSWRTLVQGLIFDVFAGIVAAVAVLSGADPFQKQTWIAFGVLLLKSVVSAVISYFMRLKVTPTIKTEGEKMAIMPIPRPIVEEKS
jgi:hypothetical protein